MNRLAKAAIGLFKARTAFLIFLAGIATGCWLMTVWAYVLAFATDTAITIIGQVQP